ncbi:MAG: uroporphyrinogen decarboxylase family protein [Desulfobacula sp.]|jgi:hypothetical protein
MVYKTDGAIKNFYQDRIPRAELWLGTGFLNRAGLSDTLDNHIRMIRQLGQDMICLPVSVDPADKPDLGYRYFHYMDLGRAGYSYGGPVTAVVDGPFQELVNRLGLMSVLTGWIRNREEMVKAFETETVKAFDLIARSLDQGAKAVVIADDLASEESLLISPKDIDEFLTPFYIRAVDLVHSANALAFLHSCGNIMPLSQLLKRWSIDGLASVQNGVNDLVYLKKFFGPDFVIMAGIEAELLETDTPEPVVVKRFETILKSFVPVGGLILCSSCGLYKEEFFDRLPKIYAMADGFFKV